MKLSLLSLLLLASLAKAEPTGTNAEEALAAELPTGMTVSETLEEWDRSAARYHNEPPTMSLPEAQQEAQNSLAMAQEQTPGE